jgi:superoxide dismutase, Cu-Zn family
MTATHISLLLATALLVLHTPTVKAAGEAATSALKLADGQDAGTATFTEATAGVLIKLQLKGLPPGWHGIHVHDDGKCDGDFASAGAIQNPLGAQHGFLNDEGPMAGDLPNVHIAADGTGSIEMISPLLSLSKDADDGLFDANGASLVIFENPDDHLTDPDGNSGKRIACGLITSK